MLIMVKHRGTGNVESVWQHRHLLDAFDTIEGLGDMAPMPVPKARSYRKSL
jgi:hypothetical protein